MSPATPYVLGGIVYQSDGTTVIASVTVTVTNARTGESHNGSESNFSDLLTNSSGEYSVNLASFTNGYSNDDTINVVAVDSTYGGDTESTTVDTTAGGESDVDLVLVPDEIQMINDAINEVGERVDHRRITTSYDDDTGTIEDEDTYTDSTLTMSLQIVNDERKLMSWGEVKQGDAVGFFKGKEDIVKGDLVRVPRTTGDWWRIQDVPVLFRKGGTKASYEARMVRLHDT